MTKEEWTYPTALTVGPRSGWPTHARQACSASLVCRLAGTPSLGLGAGPPHRHAEVAAEFLCEIDRYAGMDTALSVQELGMVYEWYDCAVPDVRIDV